MPFLLFQVPCLGNGMVIGVNAVIHVIISHGVAIGLVAMIVVAEFLGVRRGRPGWESFAARMLKPAAIVITGVGSVTGVGIWFTASALNPRGIGSMLRVFFWPWFLEWAVFALEVGAILVYYFGWDRWTGPRRRFRISFGAAYVTLGSLSAVLITGILGFMLTPDGWPRRRAFFGAFFNPSFLPQLVLRLGLSVTLGALFALAFASFVRAEPAFRGAALRIYGRIMAGAGTVTAAAAVWYFAAVPSRFKTHAVFSVLTSHLSQRPEVFWWGNAGAVLLVAAAVVAGLAGSRRACRILAVPAIVAAAALVGEYERVREFIRGPYIMPGYMYSNQVLLAEAPFFRDQGLLGHSPWFELDGAKGDHTAEAVYLFKQSCSSCHTIGGVNDIVHRVKGRSLDGIAVILGRTHEMVPFMPPFAGNDAERLLLASFLHDLSTGKTPVRPFFLPFPRAPETK
jgi:mono/diheme cytochrome c family protein